MQCGWRPCARALGPSLPFASNVSASLSYTWCDTDAAPAPATQRSDTVWTWIRPFPSVRLVGEPSLSESSAAASAASAEYAASTSAVNDVLIICGPLSMMQSKLLAETQIRNKMGDSRSCCPDRTSSRRPRSTLSSRLARPAGRLAVVQRSRRAAVAPAMDHAHTNTIQARRHRHQ